MVTFKGTFTQCMNLLKSFHKSLDEIDQIKEIYYAADD